MLSALARPLRERLVSVSKEGARKTLVTRVGNKQKVSKSLSARVVARGGVVRVQMLQHLVFNHYNINTRLNVIEMKRKRRFDWEQQFRSLFLTPSKKIAESLPLQRYFDRISIPFNAEMTHSSRYELRIGKERISILAISLETPITDF